MGFPWLDDEQEEQASTTGLSTAPSAEIVPAKESPGTKWLQKAQRELFDESAQVIRDSLAFRQIDPELKEPPPEWVKEFGQVEAERRLRIALAAWKNAKEAPVGFKIAKDVFVGISKALSSNNDGPKVLNMEKVQINVMAAPQQYPRLKVEKEE